MWDSLCCLRYQNFLRYFPKPPELTQLQKLDTSSTTTPQWDTTSTTKAGQLQHQSLHCCKLERSRTISPPQRATKWREKSESWKVRYNPQNPKCRPRPSAASANNLVMTSKGRRNAIVGTSPATKTEIEKL